MRKFWPVTVLSAFLLLTVAVSPALATCGDADDSGSILAADALITLKAAIGLTTCDLCKCDVDNSGAILASDALLVLKMAIGLVSSLDCPACSGTTTTTTTTTTTVGGSGELGIACTSAKVVVIGGAKSDLDAGWTGIGHNGELIDGAYITLRVKKECSGGTDDGEECLTDSTCSGGTCELTCHCDDPNNANCKVIGPTHQKHCLVNLNECTTDADCAGTETCEHFYGPPLPVSSGGNPVCIETYFSADIEGTSNAVTGEALISASLRSRLFLGISLNQPCPRCGTVADTPEVGDTFTCDYGGGSGAQTDTYDGAACTVEAVSDQFGGVSTDCPMNVTGNISGTGLSILFREITTATAQKDATMVCGGNYGFHPDAGLGFCTDSKDLTGAGVIGGCSTNADCKRCVDSGGDLLTSGTSCGGLNTGAGDPGKTCSSDTDCYGQADDGSCLPDYISCSSDSDCSGGTCGEAPEIPVSCGYYCHCGYCNDGSGPDESQPCFETSDCDSGYTCQAGDVNSAQKQPNDCADDFFPNLACGLEESEACADATMGKCSGGTNPGGGKWKSCTSDSDCLYVDDSGSQLDLGTCTITQKPCFGNRIERQGTASPMGSYCIYDDDPPACTSDSDCTNSGTLGSCVGDSSVPATAALFCIPPTTSSVINAAGGIPGPGAAGLAAIAQICRCGNGTVACDEDCDNGGTCTGGSADGTACTSNSTCTGGGTCEPQSGDGCDENCYNE